MKITFKILLAFALTLSPLTVAAHGHDEGLSDDQHRELIDQGSHSVEPQSSGGRVQRALSNFNFKKIALNAYRWYSTHRGVPHADNASANIVAMLLTSHTIETVGGWTVAGSAVANGLDGIVDYVLAAVGVGVSIPLLDPLCITLIFVYKKWPRPMNQILTVPRIFVVTGAKTALEVAGIPEGYLSAALEEKLKTKFLTSVSAPNSSVATRFVPEGVEFTIFGSSDDQTVTLKMGPKRDGRQVLKSVTFSPTASAIVRNYLAQLVAPFGINIKSLIMEMDQFFSDNKFAAMANLPYVERVDEIERTLYLKSGAFPLFELNKSEFPCEEALLLSAAPAVK